MYLPNAATSFVACFTMTWLPRERRQWQNTMVQWVSTQYNLICKMGGVLSVKCRNG